MSEEQKKRGGYRPNAGRKNTGRERRLHIRISEEAYDKLQTLEKTSFSEAIDKLIKRYLRYIK